MAENDLSIQKQLIDVAFLPLRTFIQILEADEDEHGDLASLLTAIEEKVHRNVEFLVCGPAKVSQAPAQGGEL